MDPRNPKRPDGDAGSNWAECVRCHRCAPKAKLIRHTKGCPDRGEHINERFRRLRDARLAACGEEGAR